MLNYSLWSKLHLCWSLILIKLPPFSLAALLKRDSDTWPLFMHRVQLPQSCRAAKRRQLTLDNYTPNSFCYSFAQPRKDERLSRSWSPQLVLNPGPLDCKYRALAPGSVFLSTDALTTRITSTHINLLSFLLTLKTFTAALGNVVFLLITVIMQLDAGK